MARTPLFRLIRRSLNQAHIENTGLHERTLSRRELLRESAAAAAGLALASCTSVPPAPPTNGEAPVVIVGAGIAGLTAAYRLEQAGVRTRVFEARDRVGGRMHSLGDRFADGQVGELGGEFINTSHTHLLELTKELGLTLEDAHTLDPAWKEVLFFEGQRRSEAEVVAAFRPLAARITKDLETLASDETPTYRESQGAGPLDRQSLAAWLDGAGASGWIRKLLEISYINEYGLEPDRQSALNLLLMIDPEPDPFRLLGESDERFHVEGGNERVVKALQDRLGEVETGKALEAVRPGPGGTFECSFQRGSASETVRADQLLLALPFSVLREVALEVDLPPVKRKAIRELGYGTNAKLLVGFSSRHWRVKHGSSGGVITDLPFQQSWDTSRAQSGSAGLLTNYTGGRHGVELGKGTVALQVDRFLKDLEKILPGVTATRTPKAEARFHWPTHPWSRGSYSCYLPGQWTSICGAEIESVGRLHFAGEHCSVENQGYMEGACETGEAAARRIIAL